MKKLICLLLLIPSLMACSQDNSAPEQVLVQSIGEHERCHLCGMMITKYPGPKGTLQLKNTDISPKFCSTRDMFNFALQPENQRQISHLMVHDIGTTDWEKPNDGAFIDATKAWYVYGTSRKAVMGSAVASFATKESAQTFAEEFGGVVLQYKQITLGLLAGE